MVNGFPALAPALATDEADYDAAFFPELFQLEAANFWFRARNRLIVWALRRHFPGARNFLEVGCGTGFVLRGIADGLPGLMLTASEASAAGLPFAASRVPDAELLQMDARAIPFRAHFDVAGAFDVLEHLEDDGAALSAIAEAVKAGGGVILTVPQHPFLWSAADVHARHKRRYRRGELEARVADAGLEVILSTSFVTLLLPLMFAARRRNAGQYDLRRELTLPRALNAGLEAVLDLERVLIRAGARLPVGGSRLLVARKP